MTSAYQTFYRAIGLPEWRLLTVNGRQRFAPEMLTGKFFFPTLLFAGACQLAREILAPSHRTEFAGLVVAFDVPPLALRHYYELWEKHEKNPAMADKLWIEGAEIRALNREITGVLRVVESYYGAAQTRFTPQELNETGFL